VAAAKGVFGFGDIRMVRSTVGQDDASDEKEVEDESQCGLELLMQPWYRTPNRV
jgi:hypothetical protein